MAKDTTSITSIDDEPKAVEVKKAAKIDVTDNGDNMTGDRVEIVIHQGEGEPGRQAVFLAINGHGFNIPRGVPVSVPAEVAEVLENATMVVYDIVAGKQVARHVQRFSYSVRYKK